MLGTVGAAALASTALKLVVDRPRPPLQWQLVLETDPSFPSGHVTNNVVIATLCTLFFRRWGWLYFIVAAAISYSRIYLGAHWPSDVLATFFMAAGEALLMAGLLELVWKKAAPRVVPRIYAAHPRLIGGGRPPPSPRRVNSDASLPLDDRS